MTINQKLNEIQTRLHCPKSLTVKNYAGQRQYDYRNLAGIYEAVKPMLAELKCVLVVSCQPIVVGAGVGVVVEDRDRNGTAVGTHLEGGAHIYQVATATLTDCEGDGASISVTASAREDEWRKGMSASQNSGSAASFASKYACEHLFALDSTADADDLAATEAVKGGNAPAIAIAPKKRAVASPKAKEAWTAFKSLPSVQGLPEADRAKTWQLLLNDVCQTTDAAAVDEPGWERLLTRIANEAASAK